MIRTLLSLALASALAVPAVALANVARMTFASGSVSIVSTAGATRAGGKDNVVDQGETVNTGVNGWVQLRFTDGSLMSLQPNTSLKVDEYNYNGREDGSEKGFFSLVRGAMRTVTGAIGRSQRATYRVETPNATVGIRGTEYLAALRDDGLRVSVTDGVIAIVNDTGEFLVRAGQTGFVRTKGARPELVFQKPATEQPAVATLFQQFLAGERRNGEGQTSLITRSSSQADQGALKLWAAINMRANGQGDVAQGGDFTGSNGAFKLVVNPAGAATEFAYHDVYIGKLANGTIAESGVVDGVIGWGRWAGSYEFTNQNPTTTSYLTYAYGTQATMPTTGSATYSVVAHSTPISLGGSTGSLLGGSIAVNFAASQYQIINLAAAVLGTTYTLNTPMLFVGTDGRFSNTSSGCGAGCTVVCAGPSCGSASGISAGWSGIFSGTNWSHAGLNYHFRDTGSTIAGIVGVAVLKRP